MVHLCAMGKVIDIDIIQYFFNVEITIQPDSGIARLIEFLMGRHKIRIAEICNAGRITAGYILIAGIREEQAVHGIQHCFIHIGKSTFHLIEHDAFVYRLLFCIMDFIMPAFLIEDIRVVAHSRAEDCIQIDGHQIHEVFVIAA